MPSGIHAANTDDTTEPNQLLEHVLSMLHNTFTVAP